MKLVRTVGMVASGNESIVGAPGRIESASIAALILRYATGSRIRSGIEPGLVSNSGRGRFIGSTIAVRCTTIARCGMADPALAQVESNTIATAIGIATSKRESRR